MNTQSSLVWCCVVVHSTRHLEGTTIFRNIHNYSSNDTALHCTRLKSSAIQLCGTKAWLRQICCQCHFTTTGDVTSQQTTLNVNPYIQFAFINNLYHHCSDLLWDPDSLVYNWHPGAPSPWFRQLHMNLNNNTYLVSTWGMIAALPPCVCMCSHHKA
jgi:hypothetical protein